MSQHDWRNLGPVESLKDPHLREITIDRTSIALSYRDGQFGAVSNVCNHVGGPLGKGRIDEDYIICPWHNCKFHRVTGIGEPGFEETFQGENCPRRKKGAGNTFQNIARPGSDA